MKAVYLGDEDIADPVAVGMLAVRSEIERQCVDASLVIWRNRVLKNREGSAGHIAITSDQQFSDHPGGQDAAPPAVVSAPSGL